MAGSLVLHLASRKQQRPTLDMQSCLQYLCVSRCRLAQQLMHRVEDRLQIYLQKLLSSIILGNDTDSALVDDFPNLVHEVRFTFKGGLEMG